MKNDDEPTEAEVRTAKQFGLDPHEFHDMITAHMENIIAVMREQRK